MTDDRNIAVITVAEGHDKSQPSGCLLDDGSSITLRDISSSKEISGARWTIDVKGNTDLKDLAPKYNKVEIKFK